MSGDSPLRTGQIHSGFLGIPSPTFGEAIDPLGLFNTEAGNKDEPTAYKKQPGDEGKPFYAQQGYKDWAHGTIPNQNPPTLGDANMSALQGQLNREKQMRSASTILTGGAGLLDSEQPRTASRVLLGY